MVINTQLKKIKKIVIVNCGIGNLYSLMNTFKQLGHDVVITNDPTRLLGADAIVLPGVGRFDHAMASLKDENTANLLDQLRALDKPILGICLGMQIMFEGSSESSGVKGLGWFRGECTAVTSISNTNTTRLPIIHMGWNYVEVKLENNANDRKRKLGHKLCGDYYFVHQYMVPGGKHSIGSAQYGVNVPSIVRRGKVVGVQFHPEKSGRLGLQFIQSWLEGELDEDLCCNGLA